MLLPIETIVYIDFMSNSVKRIAKNSFFQTAGSFINSAITLSLTVAYGRLLDKHVYGSLITSQTQVSMWALLVDLGLTNALISVLSSVERDSPEGQRQGFRARDLLSRILCVRLLGATLGTVIVFFHTWLRFRQGGPDFWQDVAFTPFLFAQALTQTGIAYSVYRHKQGLSVIATLTGLVLSTGMTVVLAWNHSRISWLLLSQSWGGFLAGGIMFGYFLLEHRKRKRAGETRRQSKSLHWRKAAERTPWGGEVWGALALQAWPYAIAFGVGVLSQRLDQIVATGYFGDAAGGEYGMAIRMASVPILVATSISLAVFPDLQRVGRDAPHRVRVILGAVLKVIYRYGIFMAAAMLLGVALIIPPLVPKYAAVIKFLPHFVLGVWAFWMQSFITNSLFGLRAYKQAVFVHLYSFMVFCVVVFTLPHWFGLQGVIWGVNSYSLAMCWFGFRAGKKVGLFDANFFPYNAFTTEESQLLESSGLNFLRRPKVAP